MVLLLAGLAKSGGDVVEAIEWGEGKVRS